MMIASLRRVNNKWLCQMADNELLYGIADTINEAVAKLNNLLRDHDHDELPLPY